MFYKADTKCICW